MISKEEAFNLVKNTSKFAHALAVSTMMRRLAERLGEDERDWELVGLLHDLDYDETRGDMNRHGVVASERLKGRLPENCLYAIKAHDYRTGFKPKSKLDRALIATDSVAILIEKTGKAPNELDTDTLKVELKRISSEQPWYKSNIFKCREMGLSLDEFLKLCLESRKKPKQ
jgi:putative nucleotidyltransferase with HDIG domain